MPKVRNKEEAPRVDDGVRAPQQDVAVSNARDEPVVCVSESVVGDKGKRDRGGASRQRRKREKKSDEDDKVEPPMEHDNDDDCTVYGDEDCNDVDDAVGGGDEEADVEEAALEEANLNIVDDFPEMVRTEEACNDDDCTVYGDEDCNDVDDAVGGGDEEADVEEAALEEANLNIVDDFPEMVRTEEAGSDSNSGDDIWDDDKIPDPFV